MASVNPQGGEPPRGEPQGGGPPRVQRGVSLAQLLLWLGFISLVLILIIIWAPIDPWLRQATHQAGEVDGLFKFMIAASAVVFVYVEGLTLAFALQYRRRKNDPDDALGANIHGNTRLETAWSVVPSLFLVVLAVVSLRILNDENARRPNELQVDVWGYQFGYAYDLPQYGVSNAASLVLPLNRPVYVREHSRDVIHAFWVPAFRIQYDMVPGIVTTERFIPTEKGTFRVVCTQYCGSGHSGMFGEITVGSEADFVAYLRKNKAKTLPTGGTTAAIVWR